jgi:hypothetical protein
MSQQQRKLEYVDKFSRVTKLPDITLKGMHIVVNGKSLSLQRKARAFRVLRAFFANEGPALSPEALLEKVRRDEGLPLRTSQRARTSEILAIVRVVSRLRTEFTKAFQRHTPDGFSWFHFDRDKGHWVFFRMPATGADGLAY